MPTSPSSSIARRRASSWLDLEVREDGLDELLADGIEGIERGQRVLEHHADLPSADPPHLVLAQPVDAPAGEQHFAAGDAAGRLEQADHRHAGERLAGAGLADHAEHLAGCDRERDIVDGDQRAAPRRELHAQVRTRAPAWPSQRSLGFSASRSQSPSRLIASTMTISAMPGNRVIHHSPEYRNSLPTRISVPSEGCVGRHADAEEGQRGLDDDRDADVDGRDHEHRPGHVGQHVVQQDGQGTAADDARGLHVLLVALDQRRAAHGAGVVHPLRQADREDEDGDRDGVVGPGGQRDARHAVDEKRDQDGGEGELHVGDAHQDRVEPPAEVAGEQPEEHAEHHREQHRGEADRERDAGPVQDRRQHVPALVVGAERVGALAALDPGGRLERRVQVKRRDVERILGRDPGREHRTAHADEREQCGHDGDRRPAKAPRQVVVPESPQQQGAALLTSPP